jgi:hypothetical protein
MIKVKNVRPGILLLADAGLKLAPGEMASVEKLTGQMERCLEDGLLARVDTEPEAKQRPKAAAKNTESKPGQPEQTQESSGTNDKDGAQSTTEDPGADKSQGDDATAQSPAGVKRGGK